jgi:hypothetical protein
MSQPPSKRTRSHSQPPREAGNSIPPPAQKSKEEMTMSKNSTDPLREEFETAISELTPDERAELLKMIRQRKAEKGQKYATETSRSIGRG